MKRLLLLTWKMPVKIVYVTVEIYQNRNLDLHWYACVILCSNQKKRVDDTNFLIIKNILSLKKGRWIFINQSKHEYIDLEKKTHQIKGNVWIPYSCEALTNSIKSSKNQVEHTHLIKNKKNRENIAVTKNVTKSKSIYVRRYEARCIVVE